jgi:SAM-dependent methyltransferase
MVQCLYCGLIFVSPLPNETSHIYDKTYFTGGDGGYGYVNYDRDKEPMRMAFELYLEFMEKELGRKGKLLDVGAATGYFMNIAKRRGWEAEGVEISDHAASVGRSNGLIIHTGTLESINLPDDSFDAVTLFDVAEHLRDPKLTFLKVSKILKKGGIVVVTTPDSGSLIAKLLKQRWHLVIPPEHLVLFNRKNFGNLLGSIGFTPIIITTIGKHFTLPYIFQTLFHWQKLSVWNMLARWTNKGFFSKLRFPINLHDTFFMIAKKT